MKNIIKDLAEVLIPWALLTIICFGVMVVGLWLATSVDTGGSLSNGAIMK